METMNTPTPHTPKTPHTDLVASVLPTNPELAAHAAQVLRHGETPDRATRSDWGKLAAGLAIIAAVIALALLALAPIAHDASMCGPQCEHPGQTR